MESEIKIGPLVGIPRISCLMPVYNTERFLTEAIDSILSQTLGDFEFIIINDGSTDGTARILEEYACKDPRIRVVHQPNGGIVSALNTGLAQCRSAYIARMDGDDVCMPHRFAFQVDYLDRHPNCVAVGGTFMSIDKDGNRGTRYRFDRNKITCFDVFPVRVALTAHPLAMFRRDALLRLGYRATFPHAEDYDLFLRIADFGTVDNPDEILLCYRDHGQSISRRNIELQEMAMAYAEFAAIQIHRGNPAPIGSTTSFDEVCAELGKGFPQWLIRTYVEFRTWRRLRSFEPSAARKMRWRILGSALSLRPQTFLSRDYWCLRQRILGRFALNGLRSVRSAFGRTAKGVRTR
jgi:glycosyltransferase involved in cell wall biosynthesis